MSNLQGIIKPGFNNCGKGGISMRDDTQKMAISLLLPLFEQLPLGVETSLEELADSSEGFFRNASGAFELVGRESFHDEVDLRRILYMLWSVTDEKGLFLDRTVKDKDGTRFLLRKRVEPGVSFDVSRIERFNYSMWQELVFSESFSIVFDGDVLRLQFKLTDEYQELVVDESVLAALSRAFEAGNVCSWEQNYFAPYLDGTSWDLFVLFDDGSVFTSNGSNDWPDGHDVFVGSLLSLFDEDYGGLTRALP